ncbi:MAG: hypothetical protein QXI12_02485 [Candidatus Methanomethyliaceae archaeon]
MGVDGAGLFYYGWLCTFIAFWIFLALAYFADLFMGLWFYGFIDLLIYFYVAGLRLYGYIVIRHYGHF